MWAELCFSQSHCVLLFLNASLLIRLRFFNKAPLLPWLCTEQTEAAVLFYVPLLSLDLLHLSSVCQHVSSDAGCRKELLGVMWEGHAVPQPP